MPAEVRTPARVDRAGPHASKVSSAMQLDDALEQTYGRRVANAIDRVHGDGPLAPIPVYRTKLPPNVGGQFRYSSMTGRPADIRMALRPNTPAMDLAHETGHWIDQAGILNNSGTSATNTMMIQPGSVPAGVKAWRAAIGESAAVQRMRAMRDELKQNRYLVMEDGTKAAVSVGWFDYATRMDELWARSYAQYIAVRSGDAQLLAELRGEQEKARTANLRVPEQWEDDDFEPIARAFDTLFTSLGWLH